MMIFHYINDNILITHLSYSGVYQYEAKKWELFKEINNCFVLETPPQKNLQNGGASFYVNIINLKKNI